MQSVLLCVFAVISAALAQDLVDYEPIEGSPLLSHPPQGVLQDRIARTGGRIRIPLASSVQTAVVEEGVMVAIDCSPWSNQFEGSVEWRLRMADLNGDPSNL